MTTPPVSGIRERTHRLIASRYPTVGIFDTVASQEDAIVAMVVESFTNDRTNVALHRLGLIPNHEVVVNQEGAHIIMAAFLHADERGGRFTSPELGAWYCSLELETAIAETIHHSTRRLAHSAAGFRTMMQMRELVVTIDEDFHDVRDGHSSWPGIYDPDSYAVSQAFGVELRNAESNGICYNSVRRTSGTNLVVYRPTLLVSHMQGDHFQYQWTGSPEPTVSRLSNAN